MLTFDQAAAFDLNVPEWDDQRGWKWHRDSSLGEFLCRSLGVDPRKAKKLTIIVDMEYGITVVAEYE